MILRHIVFLILTFIINKRRPDRTTISHSPTAKTGEGADSS